MELVRVSLVSSEYKLTFIVPLVYVCLVSVFVHTNGAAEF